MKVAVISDVHWSQNSSIVRSRGQQYSSRLENLIASVSWAENVAWEKGCQAIICCGDFFDSSQLNSEEISALKEVQWAPLSHVFITGNHETNSANLQYTTADLFGLCPQSTVVSCPEHYFIDGTSVEFCFLPYILERDRKPLDQYFPARTSKRIIFSHNDIKDIQYGPFLSTEGFTVDEIEQNCDLFINGHIHHSGYVTDKIIHSGNLTGQNFTEDAKSEDHCMQIIDTDSLKVEWYVNPYAYNFYKLDCSTEDNFENIALMLKNLKLNSVVTLKIKDIHTNIARNFLDSDDCTHICNYRLITEYTPQNGEVITDSFEAVDHLKQFSMYVLDHIGDSKLIQDELSTILR